MLNIENLFATIWRSLVRMSAAVLFCARSLIFLALISSVAGASYAQNHEPNEPLHLTEDEKAFLAQLGTLRVQNEMDGAPFNFQQGSQPQGFSVEYFDLIANELGVQVEYVSGPKWSGFLSLLQDGEIDIMLNVGRTPEREAFMVFSDPYLRPEFAYAVRAGDAGTIQGLTDLSDKKIAVVKGFWDEKMYQTYHPDIALHRTNSPDESLVAVSRGEADAALILTASFNHYIDLYSIPGLVLKRDIETRLLSSKSMHMGVRKEMAPLAALISKAMRRIPRTAVEALKSKWRIDPEEDADTLGLTAEEQAFVASLGTIRVHNETNWPPFNFNRNGGPQGFSVDYMNLLASKLGIRVEYVTGPDWDEFLQMMKNGRLDVMLNTVQTPERSDYLAFTAPYMTPVRGVAFRSGSGLNISSIDSFKGKTVALVRGFWEEEFFRKNHPDVQLYLADSTLGTLRAVSSGVADVAFGVVATFDHMINEYFIPGLETSAGVGDFFESAAPNRLAVRQDWPLLASSLSKAIRQVTPQEQRSIKAKWLNGAEKENTFVSTLTDEERAFLKTINVIRAQNEADYAPFNFRRNDRPEGFSIDIMKLIGDLLGIPVEFVEGKAWHEHLERIQSKELDVIVHIADTPERQSFMNFSKPYAKAAEALIVRGKDVNRFKSIEDFEGRTISVNAGDWRESFLARLYPKIKILSTESQTAAIQAVASGAADATILDRPRFLYLVKEAAVTGLVAQDVTSFGLALHSPPSTIGVRKDWPLMAGILSKAVDAIPGSELTRLEELWFGEARAPQGAPTVVRTTRLLLTTEEQAFLSTIDVLRVQNEADFPPFNFNRDGVPQGISIDIARRIGQLLGKPVEIVSGRSWGDYMDMVRNGEIDLIANIVETPSRRTDFAFTAPYLFRRSAIVSRKDSHDRYRVVEDLEGKTVAAVKGFNLEERLKAQFPEIKLHLTGSILESLQAVMDGKADAMWGNVDIVRYLIGEQYLSDLRVQPLNNGSANEESGYRFGVRKDRALLASMVSKALGAIPYEEMRVLRYKWRIGEGSGQQIALGLTAEEQEFLDGIDVLRVQNEADWAPHNFNRTGIPQGFSIDMARLLGEILGKEIKIVGGRSWTEYLEMLKFGELDMMMNIVDTPERRDYISFSIPYLETRQGLAVRSSDAFRFQEFSDLRGRTVALVRGFAEEEYFRTRYPEVRREIVETPLEALEAVASGAADATVGLKAQLRYLIEEQGFADLTVPASDFAWTGYSANYRVGVRKEWPLMASILSKAITTVPQTQLESMKQKWHLNSDRSSSSAKLNLTQQEQVFLEGLDVLRVQNEADWAPYNFSENGVPQGHSVDFMRLVGEQLGLDVEFVQGHAWGDYMKMLRAGDLDVMVNISSTPERREYLDFSRPYSNPVSQIVTHKELEKEISGASDLNGRTIAVVRGSWETEMLSARYPDAKLHEVPNVLESLEAVASGVADATLLDGPVFKYWATKRGLYQLVGKEVAAGIFSQHYPIHLGVSKENGILAGILTKAINAIPHSELARLDALWLGAAIERAPPQAASVSLTPEERALLESMGNVLRVHNEGDWPPYNFNKDGIPQGYSIDYMRMLAEIMGVRVEFVHGPTWDEFMDMLRVGTLDVMVNTMKTPERHGFMEFSRPYDNMGLGLVIRREDTGVIQTLDDLEGKTVAFVKGYFQEEFFKTYYPDVRIHHTSSSKESLEAVANGDADATLVVEAIFNHQITVTPWPSLIMKKGLDSPVLAQQPLHLAVSKEQPVLANILSKAIDAAPRDEVARLRALWLGETTSEVQIALDLTEDEEAFLRSHPVLRVSNESSFYPYDFQDNGQPKGYSVDLMKLIAKRLGIEINYVSGTWEELLEFGRTKQLDVITSIWEYPGRSDYLLFTDAYTPPLSYALAVRKDENDIQSLQDLAGRRLAVIPGDDGNMMAEGPHQFALSQFPGIEAVLVSDPVEGMRAVSIGKADAYYGSIGEISYISDRHFLTNLKTVGTLGDSFQQPPFKMAIRNDWSLLQSVFNKAFKTITEDEWRELRSRWLEDASEAGKEEAVNRVPLTAEEQAFLSQHPSLRLCATPGYPPIQEVTEAGNVEGIAADYMHLLAAKLGLQLEVAASKDWTATLESAKTRRCDIIPNATETEDRLSYLGFTAPFFEAPMVLVTRSDELLVSSLATVIDQPIGAVRGHAVRQQLQADYPEKTFIPYDSTDKGLTLVSSGELYGVIDNMVTVTHQINRSRLTNLKVSGQTRYSETFSVAVRNDWPLMLSAFDKAVAAISDEEHQEIFSRWNRVQIEQRVDYSLIWQVLAGAGAVFIIVFLWNRKLARLNQQLEQAQLEQDAILENAAAGIAFIKDRMILRCNRKWEAILGYDPGEMDRQATSICFKSEQAFDDFGHRSINTIQLGIVYVEDIEVVRKDGSYIWVTAHGAAVDRKDPSQGVIWVILDISERKRMEASLAETQQQLLIQEKMASLGTLTAGVAHEINNPANFTNASVHLMHEELERLMAFLRKLAGGDKADPDAMAAIEKEFKKIHDLADTAAEGTRRIKTIVKELRTFTRLDEAEKVKQPISEVVMSTVHLVRTKYKDIAFSAKFDDDPIYECFPSKLGQVLMNIVVNACDAIHERQAKEPYHEGKITIRTFFQGSSLIVEISDNGCGMDTATKEKIFEPFYTTKEVGLGTGLGMAISYTVIQDHGGEIKVDSEPGKGTCFSLILPLDADTNGKS